MTDQLYSEIKKSLKKEANPKLAKKNKIYNKIPGCKEYGIKTPELRRMMRDYREKIKGLGLKQRKELSLKLYKSSYSEDALFANYILSESLDEFTPKDFSYLNKALACFSGWGATDDFCTRVLQPLLEKYPKQVLSLLKKWNKSKNIWKRRASVVAFTRSIGESGKYTNECLQMCENLLFAREDLIQKGVGWALKDCMRGSKKKVFSYIKKLRQLGVSSVITLYAIRDLSDAERNQILKLK